MKAAEEDINAHLIVSEPSVVEGHATRGTTHNIISGSSEIRNFFIFMIGYFTLFFMFKKVVLIYCNQILQK